MSVPVQDQNQISQQAMDRRLRRRRLILTIGALTVAVSLHGLAEGAVDTSPLEVLSASLSMTGVVSVGLVVPHLLRLMGGTDHRFVLPGSALLGAGLLVGADSLARTLAAPAEIPIGVITALVGAPFFLFLLLRRHQRGW